MSDCDCDPVAECPRAADADDARVCCSSDCECEYSSIGIANANVSALAADLPSLNARNESPLSSSPRRH